MLEGAIANYRPQRPHVFARKPVPDDELLTILREFKTLTPYQSVKETDLKAKLLEPSETIFDQYREAKAAPSKKAFWEYLYYKTA